MTLEIRSSATDCPWRDLLAVLQARLPGEPIIEGSFLSEA